MSNIHNSRNISVFNDKYPDCHNPDEIDNILNQSELLTDENILLSDFADLDRIYGLLEYLHKFSGLSLSIIDNTGNIILSAGNQDICINYHSKHSEACNSYIDRNNYLLNYPIENNHIEYKCKNGLNYIAYPIFIENKEIALIFFGQFLYEDESGNLDFFITNAIKSGFNTNDYLKELTKVPKISRESAHSIIKFTAGFINNIVGLSYSNYLLKAKSNVEIKEAERKLSESNLLLDNIIENLPIGLQVFDKQGFSSRINKKQQEFLGLPNSDEGIGSFNVLTDPYCITNGSVEQYQKVYNGEGLIRQVKEYHFGIEENQWDTRKDSRVFDETIFPLTDANNEIAGVVALLEDVTDKRNKDKELKLSEERFRSIFDNAVSGIAFSDNKGNLILTNSAFENILGYTKDELKDKSLYSFTYPPDAEKEKKLIENCFYNKNAHSRFEKRYIRKGGKLVWVDLFASIIRDESGSPVYFVGVVNDITNKKIAEHALKDSEEKLRTVFENSSVGIALGDPEGNLVSFNPAFVEMLGYNPNELKFMHFDKFTHQGDLMLEHELIGKLINREINSYTIEKRYIRKNGSLFWVRLNVNALRHPSGEIRNFVGIIEDISTRKKAELALRDSEEKYRMIVEKALSAIIKIDKEAKITFFNEYAEKLLGYTKDEVLGKSVFETILPELINKEITSDSFVKRLFDNPDEYSVIEHENRTKSGDLVWISWNNEKLFDDNDEFIGFISVGTDITHRRLAEIELQNSEKRLRELNATKDKFFSIIAHDLRNPIGSFKEVTNYLSDNFDTTPDNEKRELLSHLKTSSGSVLDLLENLLEWSRIQKGTLKFNPQTVELNTIARYTLDLLIIHAKNKGVELIFEDGTELSVKCDVNMITTVIRNLLSNAIKFTPSGGNIKLKIDTVENNGILNARVSVIDTGIGIAEDDIPKLFRIDEYFTTEGTNKEKGSGLGLILCKEFVEKHDGNLLIESRLGIGTTFAFTLPAFS